MPGYIIVDPAKSDGLPRRVAKEFGRPVALARGRPTQIQASEYDEISGDAFRFSIRFCDRVGPQFPTNDT